MAGRNADTSAAAGAGPFGARLRAYRHAQGLSQQELAELSGLSVRTIGNLEAGRARRPYRDSIRRLADALGLAASARDVFMAAARQQSASRPDEPATPIPDETAPPGASAFPIPGESASPIPVGRVVPRQLPSAVRHFVGRDSELAALTAALEETGGGGPQTLVISAIAGTAGVGKTALAVHWAHRYAGRFPDGQLYVNLRGFDPSGVPMPAATALRRFLDALPVPRIPADLDAQVALYRSVMADKRMLIVLDNARDPEQVRPLLPGAPGCMVLITSRSHLADLIALDGAVPVSVDLLSPGEARELLVRRLSLARVTREQHATDELIALCARLPLALNVAASRAAVRASTPLSSLSDELRDTRQRLDLLSTGTGAADLRAVFSWSSQTLSPPAARMFRLLGVHPGPDVSVAAAASLAAVRRDQARGALGELTAAHLLSEHVPGRYSLHDLLRAYASEQAGGAGDGEDYPAAIGRLLDYYLHSARAATALLYPARDLEALPAPKPGTIPEPFTDARGALAWFGTEWPVLLAATKLAARMRLDSYAWQIPSAVSGYLERGGHWHDYGEAQAVALGAAEHAGDLAGQADACLLLGRARSRTGSYEDARVHLQHALELYGRLGDLAGQAHAHHSLGWMLGQQQCYREALDHSRESLRLYRAVGHRTGQARALNTVGWYGSLLGMHQQALTYCQQALELHRELGNHDGVADAWDSLGHAYQHLGRTADAISAYQEALELFRRLGDRSQQAETLRGLGDTYLTAGQPQQARDAWEQALRILAYLRHPETSTFRARLASLEPSPDPRSPS